ncbi:thymidylate kinase [Hirsutella rhossiliensis]|uniref:Thymidylate kinase n=1 Tax=Hirsutella rhossiliensis TaxID=111463 RepID=A0A9P8MN69_9HYPO|nr:thymidylate kinase [Hirsutella rhossiliensis]KAH0958225.1 thymidylate kinase [Hirsutella rhossiliensis]
MAAMTRQPFAPLDGARLQSLTSLKNRQNALTLSGSHGKRKAELLDADDFENVDPFAFKRSKGSNSSSPSQDILKKPSAFLFTSPSKPASTPRRVLQPKSPVAKLHSGIVKSSPMSAPAGRSPTRGKRSGILSSRRRTSGLYARVEPPSFNLDAAAPFSLDAALRATIAPYGARPSVANSTSVKATATSTLQPLGEPEMKASWFFDIHEDSPEQEMTNLLQHSTCVLDISSDEESEQKARRDRDEGRDKENIPPSDDVSQTSARRAARLSADDMLVDKQRMALGEMNTADFYAEGCDESSVIIVPGDDDDEPQELRRGAHAPERAPLAGDSETETDAVGNVELLMSSPSDGSSKAAVLQPIEGTGESFELWESGSAKDETEAPAAES